MYVFATWTVIIHREIMFYVLVHRKANECKEKAQIFNDDYEAEHSERAMQTEHTDELERKRDYITDTNNWIG